MAEVDAVTEDAFNKWFQVYMYSAVCVLGPLCKEKSNKSMPHTSLFLLYFSVIAVSSVCASADKGNMKIAKILIFCLLWWIREQVLM
jgi:hypothetical protein